MEKEQRPLVSVIMTAYNAEKYIGEAIESILNQTFRQYEFLIIDDCSTDSTGKIIDEYAKRDGRIKAIHNPENLYISKATNLAISLSQCDILAKMDADDIALSRRLERQYDFLQKNSDVAVVGAHMEIIDERGEHICYRRYLPTDAELREKMFRYSPVAQPTVMYRKSAIIAFGCYSPVYAPAEDLNLWFRVGTQYKFANIQEVLLKYRFFSNSSSNKRIRRVELKTIRMRWHAWRKQGYKPNWLDIVYNIGQILTMFLMPSKLRIRLFNVVRRYL